MLADQTNIVQLANWTQKFASPFLRLLNTNLQKISATEKGELVLSVYKPQDDRSLVILSMKKGESGIFLTQTRPVPLKQPNSFVQITRKYLQGKKITAVYASISPLSIIIEVAPLSSSSNIEIQCPNCLILNLDAKPPKLILAKQTFNVPARYQVECGKNFMFGDSFFESWCEWSEENTKTKKRAAFLYPLIGYCPLVPKEQTEPITSTATLQQKHRIPNQIMDNTQELDYNSALTYLPTHIRRSARTKQQFLERRLRRQKEDFPTEEKIAHLKKQSEGLKNNLYLWPQGALTWQVPPQLIEEYNLDSTYTLQKGEKVSSILAHLFREIEILTKRKAELTKRILESENSLLNFQTLVIECAISKNFVPLCQYLCIEVVEGEQIKKLLSAKQERQPYKSYIASTGQFIRVARSASDGEKMLKQMPSNHYWFHVLTGEGSHVWLEKLKGEKKISPIAKKEAGILAIHHSKHSRAQNAEIQFATRADIEKKKNLPMGKVLVRKCETFLVRYDKEELKKIVERV